MKKLVQVFVIVCFSLFLCVMVVGTALKKAETYSYYENRNLATEPDVTLSDVLDGSYQANLDEYLTDRAPMRLTLLKSKTILDEYVFQRPVVNKVVVRDNILLPFMSYETVDATEIAAQVDTYTDVLSSLNELIESYGGKYVYVGVPCQYAYYESEYPWYLENRAEYTDISVEAFTLAMAEKEVGFIDMGAVMDAEGHPSSFGSLTDNHYSIRGAYETYKCIIEYFNEYADAALSFPTDGEIRFETLPNPYMGSRSRMLYETSKVKDSFSLAYFAEEIPFTRKDNGNPSDATLYFGGIDNPQATLTYTSYMGGDIAHTEIETNRPELPNVLIYGDSFTSAVECLLYYSFNKMDSIDLRDYKDMSLADFIEQEQPDYVICIRDYQALISQVDNGDVFGQP